MSRLSLWREWSLGSNILPSFQPYICLSFFPQTLFHQERKKNMPSVIISVAHRGQHGGRRYGESGFFQFRWSVSNFKVKHTLRERPSVFLQGNTSRFSYFFPTSAFFLICISDGVFICTEKSRWFSRYRLPSRTGPVSLSNLQNCNSNGRQTLQELYRYDCDQF